MISGYEQLRVWEHAHNLVVAVYAASRRFPRSEIFGLNGQLRRASVAIPSNIAEGHARSTRREYAQFCFIARGSLAEVRYLLRLVLDLGYLPQEEYSRLIERCDAVGKMLNSLIKFLRGSKVVEQV